MTYDEWKCSPPDASGPESIAPTYHDDCERDIEDRDNEIARLLRQVAELERELADERGKSSQYAELFNGVLALLPGIAFSISVSTHRIDIEKGGDPTNSTRWSIWWRKPSTEHGDSVDGRTAEEALAALRIRLLKPPVACADPTGVSELVRDGKVA